MSPAKHSRRPTGPANSMLANSEPLVWLCGGALALCVTMIAGLLILVITQGISTFWPGDILRVQLTDGTIRMGEVTDQGTFFNEDTGEEEERILIRTGNFDLTREHFNWVNVDDIQERSTPETAVLLERLTWGRFYGFPREFQRDGETIADTPASIIEAYYDVHPEIRERYHQQKKLETEEIGRLNARLERARLAIRQAELDHGEDSPEVEEARRYAEQISQETESAFADINEQIDRLEAANERFQITFDTAQGEEMTLSLSQIVRMVPSNQLGFFDSLGVYFARWGEFLSADPREANSEGGVYPAIFGTVVMTLIMSIAVAPFGVLAALYLREYAKAGFLVSAIRIAINNLAGVPSIVFGVFGLGFFCYFVGASIDQLFFEASLPNPTYGKGGIMWAALTLALLTLPVVIVATEEALAAVPNSMREGSYACGASKWQTIRRIVLPRAMPGIMTGMILAMARGAGEVAPLMLVGAVKLAPDLPIDGIYPYVHPERSFMHLGFHIYDLGFQSQNSEAAKPMVFTTTLLLITIVAVLNIAAILIRNQLRKKFEGGKF